MSAVNYGVFIYSKNIYSEFIQRPNHKTITNLKAQIQAKNFVVHLALNSISN